ncbi:MAG: hypothetical protein ABL927_11565, partial [Bdellovibrionales bacterium]
PASVSSSLTEAEVILIDKLKQSFKYGEDSLKYGAQDHELSWIFNNMVLAYGLYYEVTKDGQSLIAARNYIEKGKSLPDANRQTWDDLTAWLNKI